MTIQKMLRSVISAAIMTRVSPTATTRRTINTLFKTLIGSSTRRWPEWRLAIAPFTAMGILGFMKKNEDVKNDTKLTQKEILLAKADALFDQCEYKKIYELLDNYRDNEDVEILWRLCRAIYNMSKTASEVECKKLIYEGYELVLTALSIDASHYAAHKWMAVFLDGKCSYEGMKARITELLTVKSHMLKAAELNPKDATILYMLGSWCYGISDLAWYQRKIAAAIFADPPKSSFEEALKYFEAAENTEPNFYSHNLLMLGKSHMKLNNKQEAIKYFQRASEYEAKNDDDQEAKKEAQKLLHQLGV